MYDMKMLKDNPEFLKEACKLKFVDLNIDNAVEMDARRREILTEKESLQEERNKVSKEIANKKRNKENTEDMQEKMRKVGESIALLEKEEREIVKNLNDIMLNIPNHPEKNVPMGRDENGNVEIDRWGEKKAFNFTPKPHWELCEQLDIIDIKRGAKIAGSGFMLYKGWGAKLERALINYFLDLHTTKHGYIEWFPPFLVNRDSMIATGQIPKLEEDMYHCDKDDDLFLIPTAEVPITNIYRNETLENNQLPLKYCAYSACFRREAGAAGKDTRGLLRLHQFNKVELVKVTKQEDSYSELEKLKDDVANILVLLGLHYRILNLCSGELSFAAAKCYDFEVWAPGVEKYLEVSSCSNFEEFQARRANIRYRDENKKLQIAHTINGSGLALPRIMVAIIENYQQEDGSIVIPEVLRPYMQGKNIITKEK